MEKLFTVLIATALILGIFAVSSYFQKESVFDPQTYFINLGDEPIVKIETTGPNSVEITNLSTDSVVNIRREFLFKEEDIGQLIPGETIIDDVPWDGSLYIYSAFLENKSETLEPIEVVTPISKMTLQRGLFFTWDELAKQREFPSHAFHIKKGSTVFETYIHGVKIIVAFEPQIASDLSPLPMETFFKEVATYFHRHWLLYQGYPITEYKIIVSNNEQEGYGDSLLGTYFNKKSYFLYVVK